MSFEDFDFDGLDAAGGFLPASQPYSHEAEAAVIGAALHQGPVAVDAASVGQGVLVMMNDEIYSGRDVTKTNTANVATFKATNGGPLGFIVGSEVHYYYRSMRPHTLQSEFDVTGVTALPRVDIIYTHIGEDRVFVDAALAAGARGLIYAGSGMGSIHEAVEAALAEAVSRGVVVVRSSRTGSGIVAAGLERWQEQGFLYADNLNPQKARLLLQLALLRTQERSEVQGVFSRY